ncbi:MAG: Hsp20/alpha crystallin family protein [Aureispira sp.]
MPNEKNSLFPKNSKFFNKPVFNRTNNKPFNKPKARSSATITENDNEYLVKMEAPNMQKEDFQIGLSNNVLTVKGATTQASQNKGANNRTKTSFSYQSFNRSFKVDESIVDQDNIEVTYTDGVLNIVIPKNEEDIQTF